MDTMDTRIFNNVFLLIFVTNLDWQLSYNYN